MILDTSKLDVAQLHCQVCIVGSGAAGITLAMELGNADLDVIMVTGGAYEETESNRKLHVGTADPPGSHEPLEEYRHRAFGGATKLWDARLVPYDAIDFEKRSFMPMSGWPIPYKEVTDRYPRAMTVCETVPDEFRELSNSLQFDLPDTLGDSVIETTTLERWGMPTDFGIRYREELAGSKNVRVLIDYHAVDLKLSGELDRMDSISVVSRNGRPLQVFADVFILAAGGIENARLLLASRSQIATGVGNQSDMVGRCYMSHISGTHGFIRLKSGKKRKPSFYRLAKDKHGAYRRRRFRLCDQAQRDLKVANVIGFPIHPDASDPSHRDAVMSFFFLKRALFSYSKRTLFNAPGAGHPSWNLPPAKQTSKWNKFARHASNVIFNNPLAWVSAAKQSWLRMQRPRLPIVLPYNSRAQDNMYFQAEQAPNPDSRLLLGPEVDEFGMPRIQARVRFSEIDYRTVIEFYRQLDHALQSDELGSLEYDEADLEQFLARLTSRFDSRAHQLGTTRISADPRSGVIDSDCKVHSVSNLYISGGSVLPTSSHANPTLTILALTLRLADHLISQFRQPLAVSTSPTSLSGRHLVR